MIEEQILSENSDHKSKSIEKTRVNGFAGDVFKLVSGTVIAQAIGMIATLLLARIYSPAAFGIYALFTSTVGIISVVSCLAYELSIVLPDEEGDAVNQMVLSIFLSGVTSIILIPLIIIIGPRLLSAINATELSPYLWLMPPLIFLGGIGTGHPALNYWSLRKKRVTHLSFSQVIGVGTTSIVQLIYGFVGFVTGGVLIIGAIIGSMVSTLWLGWRTWRDDGELFILNVSWRKMLYGIKRYRKFPLYTIWSLLMNTISWQLPTFLLASFFSPTVVGLYAIGNRVLKVPMNLIGGAISRVFYPRAAEAIRTNSLSSLVEGLFTYLITFTFFPLLTLTLTGRDVFIVVFGQSWGEAGVYAQILSPFILVWFISSPLSNLINVIEKQELILVINVMILITRISSLVIGGYLNSPRLALILFTFSGILVYGYLCIKVMTLAGVSREIIFRSILKNLLQFAPIATVLVYITYLNVTPLVVVIIAFCANVAYYLMILITDHRLKKLLSKSLFR